MYAVIDTLNNQVFGPFNSEASAKAFVADTYRAEGGDDGTLEAVALITVTPDEALSLRDGQDTERLLDVYARQGMDIDQAQQDGAQDTLQIVAEESERRRQAIDHLLRWKTAAGEILSDGAFEAIEQRVREKEAARLPVFPMRPEDVPPGYGDLVSTIIWYPKWQKAANSDEQIVVCRNCDTRWGMHDAKTGACSETFLRAAYGDR